VQIRDVVALHLKECDADAILGPTLYRHMGTGRGKSLTALALTSDCLRFIIDSVIADGRVTPAEMELVLPFLHTAVALLARHRPEYAPYRQMTPVTAVHFLRFHQCDQAPFGYAQLATRGAGFQICYNVGRLRQDWTALELYERLATTLVSQLVSLGGIEAREEQYLSRVQNWLTQMKSSADDDRSFAKATPRDRHASSPLNSLETPMFEGAVDADAVLVPESAEHAPAGPTIVAASISPAIVSTCRWASAAIILFTVSLFLVAGGFGWSTALWAFATLLFGTAAGGECEKVRGMLILTLGLPACGLIGALLSPDSFWKVWWLIWPAWLIVLVRGSKYL
jgi:hypothetical protein